MLTMWVALEIDLLNVNILIIFKKSKKSSKNPSLLDEFSIKPWKKKAFT